MKQIGIKKITGKIVVKTGLHIGAGNDTVEIGGIDNPIVRNPFTKEPYIPGSSLKGKMRSLLEWELDKVSSYGGKPCSCGKADCKICRVFGCANDSKTNNKDRGPTRIIVRDAVLADEWSKKYKEDKFLADKAVVEEKRENTLNRITAEAVPRSLERVAPGVEFNFEIDYRVIDTGDGGKTDEDMFAIVKEGLRLLENDFLGGGGSRGNGQIAFAELKDENGNEISL